MSSDAVLAVCAYHRRDFDLVVVRSRPHETQAVLTPLQTAFEASPTSGLGILDALPVELLCIILHSLDVLSYYRFRHVNRRARVVATAVMEYQSLAKYGLEGLRGVLRAGLGHIFTIRDLYNPLICETCAMCGEFSGFLFLPTACRCCFACVRGSSELRVTCTSAFSRLTKISAKRLRMSLGSEVRTVPGFYSMEDKRARRPKSLVVTELALAKLDQLGFLDQHKGRALSGAKEQANYRFMVSTAFPWYDRVRDEVENELSCKGCQLRHETFLIDFDDRERVFSRSGFLSHFKTCSESQELWKQSQGGTLPVKEPEFTRRCGYFTVLDSDGLPR